MWFLLKHKLEKKKTIRTLKYFDAGEFKGNFVHKVTTAFASNCIKWFYMCLIYFKKTQTTLAC